MLLEGLPAAVYLDRYRRSDGSYLEALYVSPQMELLTGYPCESFMSDPDLWLRLVASGRPQQGLLGERRSVT